MPNSISYASKYAPELDKKIIQGAKTGFFADSKFKAKFVGAQTVYLPEFDADGLGGYDREGGESGDLGYSRGNVTVTYKPYVLSMERSKQLIIDAQDADESGVGNLVGQTVSEYTRLKVNPEIDAYVLATLFKKAVAKNNKTTFDSAKAVEQMLECINNAEAAAGYTNEQMIAFVDPVMYAALMNSDKLQRSITVSDFKQGEVNLKVESLNGVSIIPVSADRMKSSFEFNESGFAPSGDAVTANAIILPKNAASLVKKVDKVDVYSPDVVQDMDAYKVNFRLYYDLFVTTSNEGLIFAIGG